MRKYKDPKPVDEMSREEKIEFYAKVQCDFHYFNEVVLGHWDMNEEHYALCQFIQDDPHRFKLIMMPRFTFKSCIADQGDALWDLIRDPSMRILIYSDSATKAQGFLQGIKNHIEGKATNSRFREFFPKWETEAHKGKWNESQIIISKRQGGHVEPNVDTSGIESSKVGMHYDKIIFDDIVSDVNVTTKAQMDKTYDCYKKSLSLLTPKGKVLVIGTRWHFGDAYGRLLEENKERDFMGVFIRKAVVGKKYLFDNCGENSLTEKFLSEQKKSQGSYVFSCLYQNSPVDDEYAMFKHDDFDFYGRLRPAKNPVKDGVYDTLYITGTIDPAGEGEDYTAGTVCGTDSLGKIHILELLNRQHCPISDQVDWIIRMHYKYHFRIFGIETTFFRGMLKRELENRLSTEKMNLGFPSFHIEEFKTRWRKGEGKKMRIDSLAPYHERGDLLFPGKSVETQKSEFSDLAYQMLQYTPSHMPEPNDLIDALSWQPHIVRTGGLAEKEKNPKNSPAWLEEKWVEQHNDMQRMRPRRKRRYIQTILS